MILNPYRPRWTLSPIVRVSRTRYCPHLNRWQRIDAVYLFGVVRLSSVVRPIAGDCATSNKGSRP